MFSKTFKIRSILMLTLFSLFSSCYRMPTEDDYSLIPTTNNPSVTREKGNPLIPNGDF